MGAGWNRSSFGQLIPPPPEYCILTGSTCQSSKASDEIRVISMQIQLPANNQHRHIFTNT